MDNYPEQIAFTNVPNEYRDNLESIDNDILKELYSNFTFRYMKCVYQLEIIKSFILNYIKEFKFLVFEVWSNKNDDIEQLQKSDLIICIEKQCLIIESINKNDIMDIFQNCKSNYIEINFEDYNLSKEKDNIKKEINSFSKMFKKLISTNIFVKKTIHTIAAFSIRKYFYPSSFFLDNSFFKKDQIDDLESPNMDTILLKVQKDKQSMNIETIIQEFNESDFIKLRLITSNSYSSFYLVINTNNFHIYMMKRLNNFYDFKSIEHEINFCKQYSHKCFTHFYGFIKQNNKIIGFIYEYMPNGNLFDFISEHQNTLDQCFSYMTFLRIMQGIKFLHLNNLIHRDLKPLNILIDHDCIPHISDFDTITEIDISQQKEITNDLGSIKYISPEQYQGNFYSLPSDIYSFGQIIYFIFEYSDMFSTYNYQKNMELIISKRYPDSQRIPKILKSIYQKCLEYDPNKRPTIKEIEEYVYNLVKTFSFLDPLFLEKIKDKIMLPEIQQYFKEIYYLLLTYETNQEYIAKNRVQFYQLFCLINGTDISKIFHLVGKIYYEGKYLEQNFSIAKQYFEKSSEDNNSDALTSLGLMYKNGEGVEQNYNTAKEFFELAIEQKNPIALCNLGDLYLAGNGVEKNYQKSKEYFEIAIKQNSPEAFFCLGKLYHLGYGVEKNLHKARELYEISANQNNSNAIVTLGYFYEMGLDVQRDYKKAKEYYELGAKLDNNYAIFNLGNFYFYGQGCDQDFGKAKYYFEIAAKRNMLNAICSLGNMYLNAMGVEQDCNKAKEYFEIAAKENFSDAFCGLGFLYYTGQGVIKNYTKAKEYFELAAEQNNSNALNNLGDIYLNGFGVDKNYKKAKEYFEKAAKLQNNI